jgi:hypothetical protein
MRVIGNDEMGGRWCKLFAVLRQTDLAATLTALIRIAYWVNASLDTVA